MLNLRSLHYGSKIRTWPVLILLTVSITVFTALYSYLPRAFACGPFFSEAIFTIDNRPDLPLKLFVEGNIGILQPTYARSYLVVAYRLLKGLDKSGKINKEFLSVFDERLAGPREDLVPSAMKAWLDERAKVLSQGKKEIEVYKLDKESYCYFLNIAKDAFYNAEETLSGLIKKYGVKDARVIAWTEAQDLVFARGTDLADKSKPEVPVQLPEDASSEDKADRNYQIACSYFYGGEFDQAIEQFSAIAQDKNSRWSKLANYLTARTLCRKASLSKNGLADLERAETILKNIVENAEEKDYHAAAMRLTNFVDFRIHPQKRATNLVHVLLSNKADADYKEALWDYTWLMDRCNPNTEGKEEDEAPAQGVKAADTGEPAESLSDELSDWIFTFQDKKDSATDKAFAKWKENKSEAWLLSTIAKLESGDPRVKEVLLAAEAIPSASVGYLTIAYHRARLMLDSDRKAACDLISKVLESSGASMPPSSLSMFTQQKLTLTSDFEEFSRLLETKPAVLTADSGGNNLPDESLGDIEKKTTYVSYEPCISPVAAAIINTAMPMASLTRLVDQNSLSSKHKLDLVQAVFVRSVLLKDDKTAQSMAIKLAGLKPQLKDAITSYRSAKSYQEREFLAVSMILKNPAMRPYVTCGLSRETAFGEIDSYRDNWWCAKIEDYQYYGGKDPQAMTGKLLFLTEPERATGLKEYNLLTRCGTAPNYLVDRVLAYSALKPGDSRLAETLHYAVRSTRYGCTDDNTTKLSKKAFQALHKQFPTSPWTAKTPYWF